MRKIPGAGMRWYPLQSLTQTQEAAVWVRYGSGGKSEEKKEQAGRRALPVPGCGKVGKIRKKLVASRNVVSALASEQCRRSETFCGEERQPER